MSCDSYSFKNKKLLTIRKNADTRFYKKRRHPFLKPCTKFQGKGDSRSGTGARGTWQPTIFTYFALSLPLKFS